MLRRVFITVGEASGDQHAGNLIRELRARDPDLIIEGLGGDAMRAAGAIVHHETVKGAAMGWKAALRLLEMKRYRSWTAQHFDRYRPDLQICIDSWSMNWHWARLAHRRGVPVLYYIAPQIWASRPGRIKRLARYVDRIACILPFEEKYFQDRGVGATFVGHPLFDALPSLPPRGERARFPHRPPVIGLLPGSRSSVAWSNFPHMLEIADAVLREFPDATFRVPTMPYTARVVDQFLEPRMTPVDRERNQGNSDFKTIGPFTVGLNRFDELVPLCDLCLTVSGTATLHAAAHGVPLIVVYRVTPIEWNLVGRWIVKTRTFSLVNLLNDNRHKIVPEFVPWYGSNQPVVEKTLEYLRHPQLLAEQRDRLNLLIRTLNRPGASRNAANLAIDLLEARATTLFDQSMAAPSSSAPDQFKKTPVVLAFLIAGFRLAMRMFK